MPNLFAFLTSAVLAAFPAGAFAQAQPERSDTPCRQVEGRLEQGPEMNRELSETQNARVRSEICRTISESDPRVDHRSFPGAAVKGQSERLVYYRLALPRPRDVPWSTSPRRPDTVLTLIAASSQDLFSVTLYDETGIPVLGTYAQRSEQQVLLTGDDLDRREYLVEVAFENPSDGAIGGFTLVLTAAMPRQPTRRSMRETAPVVQAYAHRRVLSGTEYDRLIEFAKCDTDVSDPCRNADDAPTYRLFDRMIPGESTEDEEPTIAFVGTGGANRIVLLNKRGTSNGKDTYTPRHYRTLPPTHWLWVVYIEDDLSPFETSIDVEIKARASAVDIEEFDPSSLVSLGTTGSSTPRRVVRVGMRRLRMRNPPVVVEVAFSRLGAGYGLRQWRRVYRLRSWDPVAFGAGAFIPFTDVEVESHDLIEPGLPDGTIPDFAVIAPVFKQKPVFVMASLLVPSWRNRRDEASTRLSQALWTAAPEFVVGIGLPPRSGGQAYYAGLSWNVAWERLSFTSGVVLSEQSHLRASYRAGQRLSDKATPVSTFAEESYVGKFAFGLTIDLLRLR